jgi:hypothetical protein
MAAAPYSTRIGAEVERSPEMNIHPIVMNEIVRQRQQSMIDDAKRWTRVRKARRRPAD